MEERIIAHKKIDLMYVVVVKNLGNKKVLEEQELVQLGDLYGEVVA